MAQKELLKELAIREKELTAELEAIKTLIAVYTTPESNGATNEIVVPTEHNKGVLPTIALAPTNVVAPKGSASWSDYAFQILKGIGEGKAADISNIAIEANPNIEKKTILNAISSKLSVLYRKKIIDAEEGLYKKEGYTYKMKKEPEGS